MKALFGRIFEQPAIVQMDYNLNLVTGNIISGLISGNRRPSYRPDFDIEEVVSLLGETRKELKNWDLVTGHTSRGIALDVRSRLNELQGSPLGKILAPMLDAEEYLADVGKEMERDLIRNEGASWKREYVATPTTGVAVPYIWPTGGGDTRTDPDIAIVPSICSSWGHAISEVTALFDLPRWTLQIIPALRSATYDGHDGKDIPFGAYEGLRRQIETLQALGIMYNIQGALAIVHANAKRWRILIEAVEIREPRRPVVLDVAKDALDYLLTVPIHPIVSAMVSACDSVRAKTRYGEKDVLLRAFCGERPEEPSSNSTLLTKFLGGLMKSEISSEADTWGWCSKVKGKDRSTDVSFIQLARQLRSIPTMVERFRELSTKLGWSNVGKAAVSIDHYAADFVVTDGLSYSSNYERGWLGFSPVLSLGNIKNVGDDRRVESDFNSKEDADPYTKINYSVMTVHGYQSPFTDHLAMLRKYVPAGMLMGEDGVEYLLGRNLSSDPVLNELVNALGSVGVVKQFYTEPEGTDPQGLFRTTDWDGFAAAASEPAAINSLISGYAGQTEKANDKRALYAHREGDFYHRYPVRLARPYELYLYDERFRFRKAERFDGHILFDNEITLSASTAPIEKLINMTPLGIKPNVASLATIESDQIKES